VKRTSLDQYANIRAGGIAAIRVQEGDRLLDVQVSEGHNDVVLVTLQGRAIRFGEADVPLMGRVAQGVKGIQLRQDDGVVGMVVVRREATLCSVTEHGYAKRTPVAEYPAEARRPRHHHAGREPEDGTAGGGEGAAGRRRTDGDHCGGSAVRVNATDIPVQGRATQGKRVIGMSAGDRVVEVSRVAREGDGPRRGGAHAADASADAGDEEQLELMR
jgi:DNA gyrase subunit A